MDAARNQELDYRSSTRDVRRILDSFRAQKVDGVVLDLTKNGGGSLTEAISLTGLFYRPRSGGAGQRQQRRCHSLRR